MKINIRWKKIKKKVLTWYQVKTITNLSVVVELHNKLSSKFVLELLYVIIKIYIHMHTHLYQ